MKKSFPENFENLHRGEEFLRSESIKAIEASEDLTTHVYLIKSAMDLIDHFARSYPHDDEDTLTIQLLGIRLFNGLASVMKLLLSGYYQTSALQQRDLLETVFLLDFFQIDRSRIAIWRASDTKERLKNFRPVVIRTALDDRDGFTERKREKAYNVLSELAGHPSHTGFRMLTPVPGGDAHCGPFFEPTAMKANLEELAKHAAQAGVIFTRFFEKRVKEDHATSISWAEEFGVWCEKFYGRPFDRAQIHEMRALIEQL
jgi:hypothetical protein